MISSHKRKAGVILFLAGCITFGVAAYNPPKQNEHKNLQVLPKNISDDSLDMIMDGFKAALGVQCGFCHVHTGNDWHTGWDMASDDKPEKKIARHMMIMRNEINSKFLNFNNSNMPDTINVVTCNTCHRGNAHPEDAEMNNDHGMKPPPPGMPPPPPNTPPAPPQQ